MIESAPLTPSDEFLFDDDGKCKYWLPEQNCPGEYKCNYEIEFGHGEPYCIFHLTKQPKDIDSTYNNDIDRKFESGIKKLIEKSLESEADFIDFRGFNFPIIKFELEFPKKVDFSHSVFNEDIDFSLLRVEGGKIEYSYLDDRSLIIAKGCNFQNVEFKGEAIFEFSEINEEINFQKAVFKKTAIFTEISSKKLANFDGAIFENNVNFEFANFEKITFTNTVFNQKADFREFKANSSDFYNTVFNQEAEFQRASFGEDNRSEEVTLNQDLENSNEYESKNNGDASFFGTVFNEKVSFSGAVFFCPVDFYDTIFRKRTEFISYDETYREIQRIGMFQDGCKFIRLSLPKDEEFVFFRTDLTKASFHDTNIEKVVFRDVQWGTAQTTFQKLFRGKAYLLWDEIRPAEGMRDFPDNVKTAENYRQLVLNYESKRDYETAEYFHIGEMEIRRKDLEDSYSNFTDYLHTYHYSYLGKTWYKYKLYYLAYPFDWLSVVRKKLNGYSFYFVTSRYGTSYKQAFLVLILLVLCFSSLFLFTGIKTSKEVRTEDFREIEYNLFPDSNHTPASPKRIASDFIEGVSYTLSIITFQKERFYEPLDWTGRFALYFAVFVLTAQSALLLLAVRRQFRR